MPIERHALHAPNISTYTKYLKIRFEAEDQKWSLNNKEEALQLITVGTEGRNKIQKMQTDEAISQQFDGISQSPPLASCLTDACNGKEKDEQSSESYSPWLMRRNPSVSGISRMLQRLDAALLFDDKIWLMSPLMRSSLRRDSITSTSVSSNLPCMLEHSTNTKTSDYTLWLKSSSPGAFARSDLDKVLNHFKVIQSSDISLWLIKTIFKHSCDK